VAPRAGDPLARAGEGRAATNAHDQEAGGGSGPALKDAAAPCCETGKNYRLGVGDSKELREAADAATMSSEDTRK